MVATEQLLQEYAAVAYLAFFNTVGLSFSHRLLEADIPAARPLARTSCSFEYEHEISMYEYCVKWPEGGIRSLRVKLCTLVDSKPFDGNLRCREHRRGRTQRYIATSRCPIAGAMVSSLSGRPL